MCVSALTRTVWSALYTCAHRRLHGAFSGFTFDLRVQVRIRIRLRSATWESFMSKSSQRHNCRFQSLNTSSVQLSSNGCVCVCVCPTHCSLVYNIQSSVFTTILKGATVTRLPHSSHLRGGGPHSYATAMIVFHWSRFPLFLHMSNRNVTRVKGN